MKVLLLALIIVVVNLLPAFGPPTWALLVFAVLTWHLSAPLAVPVAALSAGIGRYLLARGSKWLGPHLPERYVTGVNEAAHRLRGRPRGALAFGALFLVSPLPSAQLFVAAGLIRLPLLKVAGFFVLGRLVTYSLYVGGATGAHASLRAVLGDVWGTPWMIALQAVLLAALAVLPMLLAHRR